MSARPLKFSVAIIGGGFSGAILAAQLLRRGDSSISVVVIEKSSSVGRGLAYGSDCSSLLLNVRARNMSAFPDDPSHFLRWARLNHDPNTGPGSFLPRAVYGRYVQAVLNEFVQPDGGDRLEWVKDEAWQLRPTDSGMEIKLQSGRRLLADRIVLALGNFPPSDPLAAWKAETGSCYLRNPWSESPFEGADKLGDVLLVGSGLTSADVAVQLRERGCRSIIHILSRHGLLPQPHKATDASPPFWNDSAPKSTSALLRLVRQQIQQGMKRGIQWQSVFDSLRPQVTQIWQSLSEPERRRFLRHVRPYWEVHRHRAAPQIAQSILEQVSRGQIQVHAGRITDYKEDKLGAKVIYRDRKSGGPIAISAERIINCTGSESDCRRLDTPLISSLLASGLARPDPLFLGLDVSFDGALVSRGGITSDSLFAVGPIRKGSVWESTAVPELRGQIDGLVDYLLNSDRPPVRIALHAADKSVRPTRASSEVTINDP